MAVVIPHYARLIDPIGMSKLLFSSLAKRLVDQCMHSGAISMPDDKRFSEAIEDLANRAVDCTHLAKAQRAGADKQKAISEKQHDDAHKLETMGLALEKDLADIKRKVSHRGLQAHTQK